MSRKITEWLFVYSIEGRDGRVTFDNSRVEIDSNRTPNINDIRDFEESTAKKLDAKFVVVVNFKKLGSKFV